MIRKGVDILIFASFLYFAIVQYNDVDGGVWILMYGVICSLSLLSFTQKLKSIFAHIASIVLGILLIINWDLLQIWIAADCPRFFDYKATYIVEVEAIREYLGILLSFLASMYYSLNTRRNWKDKIVPG